ncbi:aspartyl/asparaginyl beta-hydroxylase [Mucilaginibacter yixingensis]|uniref:Aspartyl/asparaginyl beta-hydroxylase n=1 Tax=Mucilaginibacter yixingensis TaxID=1295612 RepID=A0A2T5JG62_9SPHI|nr:aspartyl/asparaginyl beta-hydroxylase domain-containing protein [Mucilaginibacter yixingensis]PTR01417.1 aspartyl/asparaginyl beta-hydroxylase [Mucilaginibacter yixingensis]
MQIIRYARLPIGYDAHAIQNELTGGNQQWLPHLNTYHYSGGWQVLPLRSPGGNHLNPVPDLMDNASFLDTDYMQLFPTVKKLVSLLQCPVMSVRFLNLRAGSVIKEHRDHQLSFEKGEARLHFPVITHADVEFYSEDQRIILNEGECWYLNANLPHRVSNNSSIDRIHLVIDCKVNPWLTAMVQGAPQIAIKEEEEDLSHYPAMIENLRQQDNEAARQLIIKLEQKLKDAERSRPAAAQG